MISINGFITFFNSVRTSSRFSTSIHDFVNLFSIPSNSKQIFMEYFNYFYMMNH